MCLKPLYALFTFLSHPVLIMMCDNWVKSFRKIQSSIELPYNLAKAYAKFLLEKLMEEHEKSYNTLYAERRTIKSDESPDDINRQIYLNAALYTWVKKKIHKHTPH